MHGVVEQSAIRQIRRCDYRVVMSRLIENGDTKPFTMRFTETKREMRDENGIDKVVSIILSSESIYRSKC